MSNNSYNNKKKQKKQEQSKVNKIIAIWLKSWSRDVQWDISQPSAI